MKTLAIICLLLAAAACAAPRGPSVGESDLATERAEAPSAGLFSNLGEELSDHFRESMKGMAFTLRSFSRRIGEDRTRCGDMLK